VSTAYVTADELKETLSLTGESYADADVALALEAAARTIDNRCGRRFYADADAASVKYYSPWEDGLVRIDDLVTLTSLQSDPGGDGTYEQTWTRNTDFVLLPEGADNNGWPWELLRLHGGGQFWFPTSYPRTVKVTGKFGWAAVPAPIKQATSILASRLLKRAREAPFSVAGFGLDGAAVRVARIDFDVESLITPYVRAGVPFV
jgi:hypothetical protein